MGSGPSRGGYREALAELGRREAGGHADVAVHEENVARTAVAIAASVGYPRGALADLGLATRYHDVGKMDVPDSVLRKPGRLDDAEWAAMREHAVRGARTLRAIPGIPEVFVAVARYHHERYDGLGYEGLSGEDIPFEARVVAIADVHDALCARRDYKPPMREDEALAIMSADAQGPALGRRAFDPVLLRKFVATRLADPGFPSTPQTRASLAAFAASDPMGDLTPAARAGVEIARDGSRTIYEPRDGGRVPVATVGAGGERRDLVDAALVP